MEAVVFFVSAAVVLGGAVGVIVVRNPVHAALSLVATLFGVAIQFINLEAYFVAVVQVIVYAGAIVVLFLFVIMLLGVDKVEDVRTEPIIGQRQLAALAGAGLLALAVLVGIAVSGDVTGVRPSDASPSQGGLAIEPAIVDDASGVTIPPQDNVREVGRALFKSRYIFAFEITGLLLTIAVVGAVTLARRPVGDIEEIPELDDPWIMKPAAAVDPDGTLYGDGDGDDDGDEHEDAAADADPDGETSDDAGTSEAAEPADTEAADA